MQKMLDKAGVEYIPQVRRNRGTGLEILLGLDRVILNSELEGDVLTSSLKTCKSVQKSVFEIVHSVSIISDSFCFGIFSSSILLHSPKVRSVPLSSVTLPFRLTIIGACKA